MPSEFGTQYVLDGMTVVDMFFLLTITDDNQFYFVPVDELTQSQIRFAELIIPVDWKGVRVAATCYCTEFPPNQPMPFEMLLLQQFLPTVLDAMLEQGVITSQFQKASPPH